MNRLKTGLTSLTGLALIAIAGTAIAHTNAQQKNIKPELNFVQTAKQVTFAGSKQGKALITLHGVSHKTLWFTNRPVRKAGSYTTAHFINNWGMGKDSFATDNPNATLTANTKADDSGETVMEVFKLSQPNYLPLKRQLSYRIQDIYNKGNHQETLYNASLFIDFCFPPFSC